MSKIEFNNIYNIDCIEGMKSVPSHSIDLVITDPPFGIDFKAKRTNYNRKSSRVIEGYTEIVGSEYLEFTFSWLSEVKRLLKYSGSMYIFSGWNYLKDILIALDELGFITINHIIWKYQFGVVTKRKFVTSHYHILYVCLNDDNKRKFFPFSRFNQSERNQNGKSLHYDDKEDVWEINEDEIDVWNIKREYWTGDKKTPTKLPAEIIKKILSYSSEEDDVVFDPFLGSGQVAVVSKMMNRNYFGFEIVKDYFEFAKERLENNVYRIKDESLSIKQENVLSLFEKHIEYGNTTKVKKARNKKTLYKSKKIHS
jgi:site-specific DNA-methyltransferase (adenine-specific)